MLQIGNDNIKEIYVGSDKIKEVYHGSDLVWSGKKPSYAILTDYTRIDFELENTPMSDLEGSLFSTSITLNGGSYQKTTIKEITFGNSYGNVTSIVLSFLRDCSSLTSLDLSAFSNVTNIDGSFLRGCSSLTSLDLSAFSNVTSIYGYFLRGCSSLTQFKIGAINVPQTTTTGFLQGTTALTTILVPMQSVQAYKTTSPWLGHGSKISAIQDGYWVHKDTGVKTYFGLDADFITDGIMSSPSWKFDCSEVNIPVGVTSLESQCFQDCSSLTSINIPESVVSLGENCFRYCTSLTLATVLPTIPPSLGNVAFNNTHPSLNIKVHSPYVNDYKTTTGWSSYADKISALEESAGDGYWVHKDTGVKTYFGLEEVSIGTGKMGAPSWRFDCSEVKIPYGVTELDTSCFSGCSSLTSITLPESVTHLWNSCFNGCSSLTSITLPESFISLGVGCFRDCSSLTSITIPSGVTSLGGSCFYGCTSLTSITIPAGITSIGYACFYECTSLTLATVRPATPPSLGEHAFDVVHSSFNIKVHFPYVNAYKTATGWINYESIISAI